MKYKEYHYRVNSIKKQIDKLRQINNEQHFVIYKLKSNLNNISLECTNLKTDIVKLQSAMTNLLSSNKLIIKKEQ